MFLQHLHFSSPRNRGKRRVYPTLTAALASAPPCFHLYLPGIVDTTALKPAQAAAILPCPVVARYRNCVLGQLMTKWENSRRRPEAADRIWEAAGPRSAFGSAVTLRSLASALIRRRH